MIRLFLCGILLCAFTGGASAQPTHVQPGDLGDLSPTELARLSDPYFKTFESQVTIAVAKARVNQAKGAKKAAERLVEAEEADKKAAEAEKEAAQKNQDASRISASALLMTAAETDLMGAKAFREWKKAEVKVFEIEVSAARATQELHNAEFELAKANLLIQSGKPAASKYKLSVFQEKAANAKKKSAGLRVQREKEAARAEKLKTQWEALAGQ